MSVWTGANLNVVVLGRPAKRAGPSSGTPGIDAIRDYTTYMAP